MKGPLKYFLDHITATVELTLTANRLLVQTQGKGAIDKPKVIDISLAQLKYFCLVPTIKFQNLESTRTKGDHSYDSEFIFTYDDKGKINKKRIFVNSQNPSFILFINELQRICPESDLLHVPPVEAMKKMEVLSASRSAKIFIGILVGAVIIAALIFIFSKF